MKQGKFEKGSINDYLSKMNVNVNILVYSRVIELLKDVGIHYHAIIASDNISFQEVKEMTSLVLNSMPMTLLWVLNELSGGELVSKFEINIANEEKARETVLRDLNLGVIEKVMSSFFSQLPESSKSSMLKLINGLKVQRNSDIAIQMKTLLEDQEFSQAMKSNPQIDQLKGNLESSGAMKDLNG